MRWLLNLFVSPKEKTLERIIDAFGEEDEHTSVIWAECKKWLER